MSPCLLKFLSHSANSNFVTGCIFVVLIQNNFVNIMSVCEAQYSFGTLASENKKFQPPVP